MSTAETVIVSLIHQGVFRLDAEGRLWRCQYFSRTGNPRPISPKRADQVRLDGYARVRVGVQGVEHNALAHRVVWTFHHGPIPPGYEINHKDGQRSHNTLSNLELVTPSQNLQHAYTTLDRPRAAGERNGRHKLTQADAQTIRCLCAAGASHRGLARQYGVSPVIIRKIHRGVLWRNEYPAGQPALVGA